MVEETTDRIGDTTAYSVFCTTGFNKFYKEEHLDLLSKVPTTGHQLAMSSVQQCHLTLSEPGKFFTIREFDNLEKLAGSGVKAVEDTEWTARMIKEIDSCVVRMWKLVQGGGNWKQSSICVIFISTYVFDEFHPAVGFRMFMSNPRP